MLSEPPPEQPGRVSEQKNHTSHDTTESRAAGSGTHAKASLEQLPDLLKQQPRWCRWTLAKNRAGDLTKRPDCSTMDSDARLPFSDVADTPLSKKGGVGFITGGRVPVEHWTGEEGYLVALDYDNCRDPQTDKISPWAEAAVLQFESSYTEVSPSGFGLRQFLLVRELPERIKSKLPVGHAAVPGCKKTVECQLFGVNPGGGFVTMTGNHVETTSVNVEVIDSLKPVVEQFGFSYEWAVEVASAELEELPEGRGEPPSPEVIKATLRLDPQGRLLVDGKWEEAKNGKGKEHPTASEAYFDLLRRVIDAANGHGRAAIDFLLDHTAWGRGLIENSLDPDRYAREDRVVEDALRVWGKTNATRCTEHVFDDIEDNDEVQAQVDASIKQQKAKSRDGDGVSDATNAKADADKALAAIDSLFNSKRLFVDTERVIDDLIRGKSSEVDDALVPGFAVRKTLTNFVGGPKAGKTTFLISILCGLCRDDPKEFQGFGKPERPLQVLYFSENSPMTDSITLALSHPDDPKVGERFRFVNEAIWPETRSWEAQCDAIAHVARRFHADIVVLDVIHAWVPNWEKDTSDQAEVTEKLKVAKRHIAIGGNVALLNVLHSNKQADQRRRGTRPSLGWILGSQAWRGATDANVLAVRCEEAEDDDRLLVVRENRNSFHLVQKKLVNEVPERLQKAAERIAPDDTSSLLCFEPVVEEIIGGFGAMQSYRRVPVPALYHRGKSATTQADKEREKDELFEACQVALLKAHSGEDGHTPLMHLVDQLWSQKQTLTDEQRLAGKERLAAALQSVGCDQQSPGSTTWRRAEKALTKEGALVLKTGPKNRRFLQFVRR